MAPSLDTRQDMAEVVVSELGKQAVNKAINEWGQSTSKITHLICCTTMGPRMPGFDYQVVKLLGHALIYLLKESCSAIIVGSNPMLGVEKPIVELVSTTETLVPNSAGAICETIREHGLIMHIGKEAPDLIGNHTENRLIEVFHPLGISDWNSVFWAAHSGGRAILEQVEA
ncbi:chalcone synthase 3-like [Pistacia vera]|uniref:chalcone synthase 3-like n=1 Tax=Pistacia vera TaxID=55513 RepID=UPI0012638CF9|nr:chalcone synthase 3-like [Pistacia vera]